MKNVASLHLSHSVTQEDLDGELKRGKNSRRKKKRRRSRQGQRRTDEAVDGGRGKTGG